ncbi:hypothetical protein ACO2Q0_02590 [Phenylobacterium sp. VNQ135]|uniref:hypothetical protein n=1 Tax=Phenylobacterium sp. VNQ135 TaxID=3400922 RepID=UPI003C06B474
MTDRAEARKALVLATAAWAQLHGLKHTYEAAILRGDDKEAQRLRDEAHSLLDSNLDLHAEAAHHAKALLGG